MNSKPWLIFVRDCGARLLLPHAVNANSFFLLLLFGVSLNCFWYLTWPLEASFIDTPLTANLETHLFRALAAVSRWLSLSLSAVHQSAARLLFTFFAAASFVFRLAVLLLCCLHTASMLFWRVFLQLCCHLQHVISVLVVWFMKSLSIA